MTSLTLPKWAQWDLRPFVLKIERAGLADKVYVFGINCTSGTSCSRGFAATPVALVRLVVRDQHLLIVDHDHLNAANDKSLRPLARWRIVEEDETFLYATPDLGVGLSLIFDLDSIKNEQQTRVHDRFFHDFRSDDKGLWFHETIRYESTTSQTATADEQRPTKGTDTFTVYLLVDPFHADFTPKVAIPSVGYFTNAPEEQEEFAPVYGPRSSDEVFNTNQYKAVLWARGQTVEWIVDPRCPDEIYPIIVDGIMTWNGLTKNIQLTVRRARPDEELDTPHKNVLFYEPGEGIRGGVANFSYHPETGETFRAAVLIKGPRKFHDSTGSTTGTTTNDIEKERPSTQTVPRSLFIQYGNLLLTSVQEHFANPEKPISPYAALTLAEQKSALQGIVGHEIGHTLGLRHNLKGHTYVEDLQTHPAGSSIMDYPKYFQHMKLGPYDTEAIGWGYEDRQPSGKYAFCTDDQAGWSYIQLAHDPQCQRWSPPTADYFKDTFAEAQKLIEQLLPTGIYETENDFSVMDLGLIFSYLRAPETPFFDARQFEKVYGLIGKIAALPAESPLLGNTPYWLTMLVTIKSFSSQFRNDLLPISVMFKSPHLDGLLTWVSRYPGKSNFDIREKTVKEIRGWADSPYGLALYKKLVVRLEQEAESTADMDLRVENRYLLEILNNSRQ